MSEKMVKVWDPLVRIFHWSVVLLFVIAYLTGEEESNLHNYSGYILLGLVVFRVLWGFIGSQHARFRDFIKPPGQVVDYLQQMRSGTPPHYLGHNPAGGYMIIALLVMLFITSVTGIKVLGLEGQGPLAQQNLSPVSLIATAHADDDRDEDEEHEYHNGKKAEHDEENEAAEEFWEEIHEAAANLTILLVLLHILGVVISGKLHGENLVKAMFTGKKQNPEE